MPHWVSRAHGACVLSLSKVSHVIYCILSRSVVNLFFTRTPVRFVQHMLMWTQKNTQSTPEAIDTWIAWKHTTCSLKRLPGVWVDNERHRSLSLTACFFCVSAKKSPNPEETDARALWDPSDEPPKPIWQCPTCTRAPEWTEVFSGFI